MLRSVRARHWPGLNIAMDFNQPPEDLRERISVRTFRRPVDPADVGRLTSN